MPSGSGCWWISPKQSLQKVNDLPQTTLSYTAPDTHPDDTAQSDRNLFVGLCIPNGSKKVDSSSPPLQVCRGQSGCLGQGTQKMADSYSLGKGHRWVGALTWVTPSPIMKHKQIFCLPCGAAMEIIEKIHPKRWPSHVGVELRLRFDLQTPTVSFS